MAPPSHLKNCLAFAHCPGLGGTNASERLVSFPDHARELRVPGQIGPRISPVAALAKRACRGDQRPKLTSRETANHLTNLCIKNALESLESPWFGASSKE